MTKTLEALGTPLQPSQRQALTNAFVAERAQLIPDMQSLLREARESGKSPDQIDMQEFNLNRQIASNQRLLDAVAPHLDARQLEAFKAPLDLQIARMRAANRIAKDSK